ncbi:uncharacterized protein LOC130159311 [Falco biarmicus]|uniref:uncharacterized protein LOC129737355 n=1 Tax=Falco cherrug TaxID=345164 RepID=UPI002479C008|nr:uncharacterized protein LOC129737355 [Falco cherrug]XP_055582705.1 uncharacterized protein LOC129737355 [Falco cherrug]XP_056216788.1 uncharacterized protein LOC130159311 [Falco biarmicus]XP_056216789.1 uncharacterized protein LOC130159311 [Falco biarmicus]
MLHGHGQRAELPPDCPGFKPAAGSQWSRDPISMAKPDAVQPRCPDPAWGFPCVQTTMLRSRNPGKGHGGHQQRSASPCPRVGPARAPSLACWRRAAHPSCAHRAAPDLVVLSMPQQRAEAGGLLKAGLSIAVFSILHSGSSRCKMQIRHPHEASVPPCPNTAPTPCQHPAPQGSSLSAPRILAFPLYKPTSAVTCFSNKTNPTWPSPDKTLPASVDTDKACWEAAGREKPLCIAKFISTCVPSHSKSNTQNSSLRGNALHGGPALYAAGKPSTKHLSWVAAWPRRAPHPRTAGTRAVSILSSPPAAPRLLWGFGMVPPYLHAPYHSRAHPAAVPSRRMFAECLQVARQRSGELIFLLIKGRKISLFLNREKTTEGRAQKL